MRNLFESNTSSDQYQMNLSRVNVKQDSFNYFEGNSPFHPMLSQEINISPKPELSRTNRVISKYENRNPNMRDEALYHIRGKDDLNYLNQPQMADNVLHKRQMAKATNKVKQHIDDQIPYQGKTGSGHTNVFNPNMEIDYYSSYNPNLPISDTNMPLPQKEPYRVDERDNWYNNSMQRTYIDESDRSRMAYNLQRSQDIKDRNMRQAEASDAFFKRTKKNRWIEDKMGYVKRAEQGTFTNENELTELNNRLDPTVTSKETYDVRTRKYEPEYITRREIKSDIGNNFEQLWERGIVNIASGKERFNTNSIDNRITNLFDSPFEYITSTILNFLDPFKKVVTNKHSDRKDIHDSYGDPVSLGYSNNSPDLGTPERHRGRPDHVLVVRKGEINEMYPDENYDATAPSALLTNPCDFGVERIYAVFDGPTFKIIQTRNDRNMLADENYEEILVTDLPIEVIDDKFRMKVQTYNPSTNRDKPLLLEYEDFIQLSEWCNSHPEFQTRYERDQIHMRNRHFDIEEELNRSVVFADEKVYTDLAENSRRHQSDKLKGRFGEEQIIYDNIAANVAHENDIKNKQHYNLIAGRTSNVNLKRFNS